MNNKERIELIYKLENQHKHLKNWIICSHTHVPNAPFVSIWRLDDDVDTKRIDFDLEGNIVSAKDRSQTEINEAKAVLLKWLETEV